MWKQDHDVGSVLWPGGKMPPDTAGKDARRYKTGALPECGNHSRSRNSLYSPCFCGMLPLLNFSQSV
jgi:hypothetical protein